MRLSHAHVILWVYVELSSRMPGLAAPWMTDWLGRTNLISDHSVSTVFATGYSCSLGWGSVFSGPWSPLATPALTRGMFFPKVDWDF